MAAVNSLLHPVDTQGAGNVIQLKLRDVAQLFNSLDPSPFNDKDLDHDAEEFILSWARELRQHERLKLVLHLDNPLPPTTSAAALSESIRHYFAYRASINRLEFRQLLKQGRTSLLIGTCFLAGCLFLGQRLSHRAGPGELWEVVRESLSIGGWVAMWRPMEIYLYDWWPLKRRGDLLAKLSHMQVDLRFKPAAAGPR
jgi:hypothetical protein